MSDGIIVEKKIVFKAIDEVTSPLTKMNQKMTDLESKLNALGLKFNSGASEQTSFKSALNSTKASLSETSEASKKLENSIKNIKSKDVKVKADTNEGNEKVSQFKRNVDALRREKPTVKPTANTNEANNQLNRLKRNAEDTGHSFTRLRTIIAGTALGSAIGNGAIAAFNGIKNGIAGAMHAGIQFNMTMQQMNATWDTLTGSSSKAKAMSNSIVDLSNKLGWGVDVTNELAQQFYHVFDNQPETMKLTKSFLTMGDAIGLSSDRLKQVGMDFTHMLSSSKLQLGDLNQITDAFPMFGEALLKYERKVQHNSHLTMSQLRDDISAGKISAKDAEKVFNGLGDKYKKASENLMGTLPGMFRQISAKWKQLMGSAMAPTTDAVNPVVKQVSEWIKDKSTTREFENLGKAVNNGVGSVMKALADAFGNGSVSKMLDNMVNGLTRMVQAVSKWTANNAESIVKTIKALGSIAGSLGKGAFDAIGDVLKIISGTSGTGLKGVANALEEISKHKTTLNIIGRTFAMYFVYSKTAKMANGLLQIGNALGFIGKHQISGNLFKDLAKGISVLKNGGTAKALGSLKSKLEVLKKFKINPANWFKGKLDITKFIGKGNSFKGLFSGLQKEAEATGTSSAKVFANRFGTLAKSNIGRLGGTLGGRLAGGITLAMAAVDLFKGLHQKGNARATSLGKGFGTIIGGAIGGVLGGPVGMAIGSTLGQAVGGKLGPTMGKFGKGTAKLLGDIFKKHDWNAVWEDIGKGWKSFWKGMGDWWDKMIGKKTSSHGSSSSKKPYIKEIKSLGGNNYSRADIANIKEMNRAVIAYTNTLKTLKQTVKHNDPTKALNSMNKGLKNFIKGMAKSVKPLEKLAKTFKSFGKSTKTMANSIKSLTGKHGLGEFDKDLEKLNKSMKNTKVGTYFEKLSKSIKKSKLADTIKKLDKWLGGMVKDFKQLDKPLKQATKEFESFEKSISKLANKKTGLSKVDTDLIKLSKDMRKYDFGKAMEKQINVANKAVGKHGFVKQFNSMVESIRKDLQEFSSDFKRYWSKAWSGLSSTASRALRRANSTVRSQLNSILSKGRSFESSFKSGWRSWNNTVVSTMRSAFDRLPGIASKAMSEIIGRLNKGISGINKVISDFGGDKKLNTISYAKGTLVHPGGKALLNDGLGANKTELLWQPSKGWSTLTGQNRVYDLEKGSMVMDAEHSAPVLRAYGSMIPHYADGTLSDDEMDKIAEGFMNNPVKASRELILKLTDWSSSKPIIPSLGKATAIGFSRGIANVLKDLLGIIKEPINGDWGPVIKSAARLMHAHINSGFVSTLKQVIQNESGGIENRIQDAAVDDVNMRNGNPAQGLLQYIPQTFHHYAMPKYQQILKGFDQLIAFFNNTDYAHSIGYNSILHKIDWLGSGPTGGRRFAMGGRASGFERFMIADNPEHDEFIVNPYASTAPAVMREAMQTMDNAHPEYRNSSVNVSNAEMINLMHETIDAINGLELQPVLPVDETRRKINNMNNQEYVRLRG